MRVLNDGLRTGEPLRVIVILGASNDEDGRLSPVAIERAEAALMEYRRRPGIKVVATGGFGSHFNTSSQPHSVYMVSYLTAHGVHPEDILGQPPSCNTVEDAILTRELLEGYDLESLTVITSDFHAERARMIFKQFFPEVELRMIGAPTKMAADALRRAIQHEQQAIDRLRRQGGVIFER